MIEKLTTYFSSLTLEQLVVLIAVIAFVAALALGGFVSIIERRDEPMGTRMYRNYREGE